MLLISELITTQSLNTAVSVYSPPVPLGALLDALHGNPQKQPCIFFFWQTTQNAGFIFFPFLQPRKANHVLPKPTELQLSECKVLTCCTMSLKLIPPWGTKARQLVLSYDLAQHSYFLCFNGSARTKRELLGENIKNCYGQRENTVNETN